LVSCGSCLDILIITELNKPRLVNGVWWYFTPGISFGCALFSSIRQSTADVYLIVIVIINYAMIEKSWHLEIGLFWRLGSLNCDPHPIYNQRIEK